MIKYNNGIFTCPVCGSQIEPHNCIKSINTDIKSEIMYIHPVLQRKLVSETDYYTIDLHCSNCNSKIQLDSRYAIDFITKK